MNDTVDTDDDYPKKKFEVTCDCGFEKRYASKVGARTVHGRHNEACHQATELVNLWAENDG